jgi:hypothetical protein
MSFVSSVIYYGILFAVSYFIAKVIISPYYTRYCFRRYPNVLVKGPYLPFIGDGLKIKNATDSNKTRFSFVKEEKIENPEADMQIHQILGTTMVMITSTKAAQEVSYNIPFSIDRV